MFTGKMTATWLILLTIAGCSAVPVLMIYYTTVQPFTTSETPKMIMSISDLLTKSLSVDVLSFFLPSAMTI